MYVNEPLAARYLCGAMTFRYSLQVNKLGPGTIVDFLKQDDKTISGKLIKKEVYYKCICILLLGFLYAKSGYRV